MAMHKLLGGECLVAVRGAGIRILGHLLRG